MTQAAETPWERIPQDRRKKLVWGLWFVTWLGLLAGLFDHRMYEAVVAFCTAHAALALALNRFRLSAYPVQVRIVYAVWVAIGTYAPHGAVLLYIATLGLIGNLFFDYCLLARMLYLLPWNRTEKLSLEMVERTFLSPPSSGRFRPTASS